MPTLPSIVSPSGDLRPRPFVVAALAVYAAGAASQWLTGPGILAWTGLWPFALVQALLVWLWYAIHARRLRDAGSPTGLAAGPAVLYALSVVLLLFVAVAFFPQGQPQGPSSLTEAGGPSALGLLLFIWIIATLAGTSHYDVAWFVVTILMMLALVPIIVAVAVTLWAATRPSIHEAKV